MNTATNGNHSKKEKHLSWAGFDEGVPLIYAGPLVDAELPREGPPINDLTEKNQNEYLGCLRKNVAFRNTNNKEK